jgi:acyl-CoA reductase-like NAD-dependent aldehyde dehydrogenase
MLLSQSVTEFPVSPMTTQIAQSARMLIGGEWVAGQETYPVLSPIDGQVIGSVPTATPSEIEQAIIAAKTSLKTWGKQPGSERGQVLL